MNQADLAIKMDDYKLNIRAAGVIITQWKGFIT